MPNNSDLYHQLKGIPLVSASQAGNLYDIKMWQWSPVNLTDKKCTKNDPKMV